jgi:hypothetical protein
MLLKPVQPDTHNHNVDEAEIGNDRDDIEKELLVCREILQVDAISS